MKKNNYSHIPKTGGISFPGWGTAIRHPAPNTRLRLINVYGSKELARKAIEGMSDLLCVVKLDGEIFYKMTT